MLEAMCPHLRCYRAFGRLSTFSGFRCGFDAAFSMSGPDSVDVYQAGASLRTLLACIENSNEENAAEVLLAAEAVEKVVSCVQRFGSHPAVVIPGLQVTRTDSIVCEYARLSFVY